jgi:RNA polymerase sigma-70 factor (ECF subfamily)
VDLSRAEQTPAERAAVAATAPDAPGDPGQWLDGHGDALYGYAMLRVHDPAVAEDLVQDTLLAAWTARASFRAEAGVRTWLIGILKHKIVDHLRRASREQPFVQVFTDDEDFATRFDGTGHWITPPADWGDPAHVAESAQLRQALMRCIERLPERLRQLLVLREIDGYPTAELQTMLGIPSAGNLWVMLSRGRERLRGCMERAWAAGRGA